MGSGAEETADLALLASVLAGRRDGLAGEGVPLAPLLDRYRVVLRVTRRRMNGGSEHDDARL